MSPDVGVVLLTGNGPSPKDGGWAFCRRWRSAYPRAQRLPVRLRRDGGHRRCGACGPAAHPRGAAVDPIHAQGGDLSGYGWAAGGGHSLHSTCDLTLASREHARFKQTDADVGSFDGGYGSAYLARQVGQKFAREIFFLGRAYTAEQMHRMGAVNEVVEHAELESVGVQWAAEINAKSPQAQRTLKYAFNLLDDGLVGQQLFAGEATRLAYMTDEAVEGRDAFLEKRDPDYGRFPRYF